MKNLRSLLCLLLIVCLLGTLLAPAAAAAVPDTHLYAAYTALLEMYPSAGYKDEWVVFALCTANPPGYLPVGYLDGYEQSVLTALEETGGVISQAKVTDYVTLVLALTAAGCNAADFGGYDLTAPLQDLSFARRQGVNGIIYSLLALDYAHIAFDGRDDYLAAILDQQLSDGGWALTGANGDVDMTAMALQALSRDTSRSSVRKAVQAGLDFLASKQNPDGGFSSYGAANPESTAQVLLALGQLGLRSDIGRFTKPGGSLQSALLQYQTASGAFSHTLGGDANTMSTVQALLGLCQIQGQELSRSVFHAADWSSGTFIDLEDSLYRPAVYTLNRRGIMNGVSETRFDPEGTLTRAMAVTILWRLAGCPAAQGSCSFGDVPAGSYYRDAVIWGTQAGVVQGTGEGQFSPDGLLTRQELTVLLYRYTQHRGLDTSASTSLLSCQDYASVASWASRSVRWACALDLLSGPVLGPEDPISRGETAMMLCRWLEVFA